MEPEIENKESTLIKVIAVVAIALVVIYALYAVVLPMISTVKEKANDTGTQFGGAVRTVQGIGVLNQELNRLPDDYSQNST